MKTRYYFKLFALLFFGFNQIATAQTDVSGIEISPVIFTNDTKIPKEAQSQIIDKLGSLLLSNGITNGVNSPLIITPKVSEIDKIIDGAPTTYIVSLEINFYIGNQEDGNLFASKMIPIKGAGRSMTQAYIDAFKQIKSDDKKLITLINDAKSKIINYYEKQCETIIATAKSLASRNQFDEALYKLVAIPVACKSCYAKVIALSNDIYSKKIDYDCKTKLLQATNLWNANQHYDGATQAGEILNAISPNSKCFSNVIQLTNTIQKRVLEVDKREWNFEYEQGVGLEKDRIEAIKEIGKAYGAGQPKNVNVNNKYKW